MRSMPMGQTSAPAGGPRRNSRQTVHARSPAHGGYGRLCTASQPSSSSTQRQASACRPCRMHRRALHAIGNTAVDATADPIAGDASSPSSGGNSSSSAGGVTALAASAAEDGPHAAVQYGTGGAAPPDLHHAAASPDGHRDDASRPAAVPPPATSDDANSAVSSSSSSSDSNGTSSSSSNGTSNGSSSSPGSSGIRQYQADMLRGMLSFLGPAALVPMGDALMSLGDTVCIGQFAGTSQLAALGPANLIFSFAQYMFQSLQVATLSLVARQVREGQLVTAEETLSCGIVLAVMAGLLTTAILEAAPEAIIRATGIRDHSLIPLATEYVRVRGLAAPAVLATMVAQSGLLAQQDSATPAATVALATLVSFAGSVVFVGLLGWGLTGAAITTVATQYCGMAALLYALQRRGVLRLRLGLPRRETLETVLGLAAPLSVSYIAKNCCYIIIQTTASGLELVKLAAHQAVFSVWNLLAWSATPLEQAAMTYLPGSSGWRKAAGIQMLVGMGAAIGVAVGATITAAITLAPHLLTRDAAVWPNMLDVSGLAGACMVLVGLDVVSNGVNVAFGDAQYVARSYIVTLSLLFAFMSAARHFGWGLQGVWGGIAIFFAVRAVQSGGRVLSRHLRPSQSGQEPGRGGSFLPGTAGQPTAAAG